MNVPAPQTQFRDLTRDEIASALDYIDPNCDRQTWAKMGMAVKNELGPDGFDIWNKWSQKGENYNATDARDTWKSIKAAGGVTIGTLIAEAQAFGFRFNAEDRTPISQDEINRRERERKEREAAEAAQRAAERAAAAQKANAIWSAAQDIDGDEHPYLQRKGVLAHGLRVGAWKGQEGFLLIPMRTVDGHLVSLQAISSNPAPAMGRAKDFLYGGQMHGTLHWVGDLPSGIAPTFVICEGYATAASIHRATGYSVAVAWSAGNLRAVALLLREKHQLATIIVAAENDQWNKTNAGMVGAQQACSAARALLASPKFKDDSSKPTDFNDLHQLEGIEAVRGQINAALPRADNDNDPDDDTPPCSLDQPIGFMGYPHCNDKYQPLDTIENLEYLLSQYGIRARYNVISKDMEVIIPGSAYGRDNHKGVSMATINSLCARNRMPRGSVEQYMLAIADSNEYNPAAEWIESRPWDGVDRLDALTASMDPADPQLAATLLRRWMIGAIGCAYNPEGMSMQGVLVLQGAQNAGKTTWFWQLVQKNKRLGKEGVSIDPADRDSVKGAISHWLVELGEIDATFKKADIESLKQFITKDTDELFLRYSRAISTFPRRTAFVGTVNPMHYLHDETGNRRYWTIQCGPGFNAFHGIDMQQAWAQAKTIWESGEQHNLTREEMSALNAANEKHNQPNPIEELIQTRFQWDAPRTVNMTSTEVLVAIGYDKPNIKQTKETGMILRKLTGAEPKKSNGKSVFVMPPYTRMARRHDDGDDRPF